MNKDMLLEILADPSASDAEKDDAVMALGNSFPDNDTVDILIRVSNESNCEEMIAASCGESIGQIWIATQQISYEKLSILKGVALAEALSLIKAQRPDWYLEYRSRGASEYKQ
ncbi:hypothetical protein ACFO9Q_03015 [Paenibacillus sp. GCM10023252]|uniref:hypothetical protein n=1 Tax=Paenibacillus sp. GCM10023252 TaxID=3252649 RepID=UPI00361BFC89